MQAENFVSSYRRELPNHGPENETSEFVRSARKYSGAFGQHLHDYLANQEPDVAYAEFEGQYTGWQHTMYQPHLNVQIRKDKIFDPATETSPQQLKEFSEQNFHLLTSALLPMWQSLLDGETGKNPGAKTIKQLQGRLALTGMPLFSTRAALGDEYFEDTYREKRATIEGTLNEIDAAIALLEIAKRRPHLHIVPGPYQFEHQDREFNSDLIAIDTEQQTVVGAQVKSRALDSNIEHYDKDHVMVIDGDCDLQNTSSRRFDRLSSQISRIGWAGLLAATVVRDLPSKGREATAYTSRYPIAYLMKQKSTVRQTVPNMPSSLPIASQHIESKLAPHLLRPEDDEASLAL